MSRTRKTAAALGALALVAAVSLAFAPRAGRWQYTIVRAPVIDINARANVVEQARKDAETRMNALGKDGWEFVQAVNGYAIFKRNQ